MKLSRHIALTTVSQMQIRIDKSFKTLSHSKSNMLANLVCGLLIVVPDDDNVEVFVGPGHGRHVQADNVLIDESYRPSFAAISK